MTYGVRIVKGFVKTILDGKIRLNEIGSNKERHSADVSGPVEY